MDGSVNVGVFTENGSLTHWNILADGVSGRVKPDGEKVYYLKDHLGSTRVVIDDNGTIEERYDYYPFGLVMPFRSSVSGSPTTKELFTGKERDAETGLDYFGARYYDASIGRWLSVDPLAEQFPGWSPYNYVFNNPLKFTDPDGRGPLGFPIISAWLANVDYGASQKNPPGPSQATTIAVGVRTLVGNPGSMTSIGLAVLGGFALSKLGSDLLQGLGHMMAESTEEVESHPEETEVENDSEGESSSEE